MALRWIEGFEGVGTSNGAAASNLTSKYKTVTASGNFLIRDGRIGGKSVEGNSASCDLLTPDLADMQTIIIGLALQTVTTFTNHRIIEIVHPDGSVGINVRLKTTGEFDIYFNTTLLTSTVGATIPTGSWGYLELKVSIDNSSGSYDFKVNQVSFASASGIDTQNGTDAFARGVRFTPSGGGGVGYIDDIYICDNTGSDNNDFLGNMRVEGLYPTAEGDQNDFTASSGLDNSLLVDENPPNDDTDYVESAVSGAMDLYNFQNPGLTTIKGVMMNTRVKETDATTYSLISVCKSSSFQSDGPASVIGSASYLNKYRVVETDPATSALWTNSGLSAAQFGVKVS